MRAFLSTVFDRRSWALMKTWKLIQDDELYLHRRRIIQTPLFALYLHRIYREDTDEHPHDHPWWFTSWVLRGGYWERIFTAWDKTVTPEDRGGMRFRHRWSLASTNTQVAHQITEILPGTVTLVLCGPRIHPTWSFWTEQGPISWTRYRELYNEGRLVV